MTVAAVILSATAEGALAPADGVARVRRLADVAWAGGAVPVVVVAPDPEGTVADALAGSEATYVAPAVPEAGPVGQILRGIDAARHAISGIDAVLVWPAHLCWVDAETVTSLIEAHGLDRASVLRPAWRGGAGWPVLLPLDRAPALTALDATRMPDDLLADLAAAGVPVRSLDLGDPGTVIGADTPRELLPTFDGPPESVSGHREWGAAADRPDDAPVDGPRIAD
jgi:CTP:molybdopterin cytidylyltransferase MocA